MVKLQTLFRNFNLEAIKLSPAGAELDITFKQSDKDAAWELYIEMLTRIATQSLPIAHGNELSALSSLYSLFPTTRVILQRHGRKPIHFTKVAIPVLNQVIRPFTAKWHRASLAGAFNDDDQCRDFRRELAALQERLRSYNSMLAHIADVEDLTNLEENEETG